MKGVFAAILVLLLSCGCVQPSHENQGPAYPHIAGYVNAGDDLLWGEAVYDVIYTSNISAETAAALKYMNPGTVILFQSPATYMFDSSVQIIEALTQRDVTDDFWLKDESAERCGYYGMWAVDIRNQTNIETLAEFFSKVLEVYGHYDGFFFDIMEEQSRCDSMNDTEWSLYTGRLLAAIREKTGSKVILANSGYGYDADTPYLGYLNGYAMESFLSGAAGYDEGMSALGVLEETLEPSYLIYTHYSRDTVTNQTYGLENMRLALTLSLLFNNTYLAYEPSMDEAGSVAWFREFSAVLGKPLGQYYEKDGAKWRQFEGGIVVSSPDSAVTVGFNRKMTDATSGETSTTFTVEKGDGRIFLGQ